MGGRRASDRVTTDDVELVFTLAYEKALENGDEAVVDSVSLTILKLREVTGTSKIAPVTFDVYQLGEPIFGRKK